jgi:hypothetical protein
MKMVIIIQAGTCYTLRKHLSSYCLYRYFPEYTIHAVLFGAMVSINYLNLMKIV